MNSGTGPPSFAKETTVILKGKLSWVNRYAKGDNHESDQTTVAHFAKFIPSGVLRDLVLATRLLGQPLPKEIVPVFNQMMNNQKRMRSYLNVWLKMIKNGDVKVSHQVDCSYCNGTGKILNALNSHDCWTCSGAGKIDEFKYVGPTI